MGAFEVRRQRRKRAAVRRALEGHTMETAEIDLDKW